jgi:uncharacterized protein
MDKKIDLNRLNVKGFARENLSLRGHRGLAQFSRLLDLEVKPAPVPEDECQGETQVTWSIQGELLPVSAGDEQIWLHLKAELLLPMQCQRCMGAMTVLVSSDQSFRFVADESTAEAEDEASEEDLLVWVPEFDVWELIEDELIMSVPLVPKHEVCPTWVPMSAVDEAFEEALDARPNPFAALAQLKKKPD